MSINPNQTNPAQPVNPGMATPYVQGGTLSINDLLAVNNTSVIAFGKIPVFKAIQAYFDAYNEQLNDQLDVLSFRTTDRVIGVGGPVAKVATMVDEIGIAPPQKAGGVGQMGFPLRAHQVNLSFTELWMQEHTPQEMAKEVMTASIADSRRIQYFLRSALFNPVNSVFVDNRVDYMAVFVKALCNADGFPIPPSPNGILFNPATHNHYMGTVNVSPADADLAALQLNVSEHFVSGTQFLYVTQEFGNTLLAGAGTTYPNFTKLTYQDQIYAATLTLGKGDLEPINQASRQIGVYQGAQVWVKPWVPTGVVLCFLAGPDTRPLAMRVPASLGMTSRGDFRPVWDSYDYPSHLQISMREYGFGVYCRYGAAVLAYNLGSSTYVAPTINDSFGASS